METDGINRRLGYQAWEWTERTKGALRAKKLEAELSNHFMVENPGQDYVTILAVAATVTSMCSRAWAQVN